MLLLVCGAEIAWIRAGGIQHRLAAGAPVLAVWEEAVWLLVFGVYGVTGLGLLGLRRWAWLTLFWVEVLVFFWVIMVPKPAFLWVAAFHGTIALSLLVPKTRHVVTPEYRRIMAQAPRSQVRRPKTPPVAWVLMVLTLLGFGLALRFLTR